MNNFQLCSKLKKKNTFIKDYSLCCAYTFHVCHLPIFISDISGSLSSVTERIFSHCNVDRRISKFTFKQNHSDYMLFSIKIDILFVLLVLLFIFNKLTIYRLRVLRVERFFFLTLVGAVGKDNDFCSTLTVSPRPVNWSYNLSPKTRFATFM